MKAVTVSAGSPLDLLEASGADIVVCEQVPGFSRNARRINVDAVY